jgi:hypothetical protein
MCTAKERSSALEDSHLGCPRQTGFPACRLADSTSLAKTAFLDLYDWNLFGAWVLDIGASVVPRMKSFGFTSSELRQLRALKTPAGIQRFLDELPYNLSFTARSPQKVLHDRAASCLEGGIFAAAALRALGFPPLIFDLEAEQDTDHVVAIFKVRGHWGAVAKSNFTGCRYREPVYRSLRELAMSYFNIYFNLRGERTLRRYSRPVNLARFDHLNWMTTDKPIWFIAEHLCQIPHIHLLTRAMEKRLTRVDQRTVRGEMVGHRKKESAR